MKTERKLCKPLIIVLLILIPSFLQAQDHKQDSLRNEMEILMVEVQHKVDSVMMEAQNMIADADNQIFVSVVSIWEIIIKQKTGKLKTRECPEDWIDQCGFMVLNVTMEHLNALRKLPMYHKDPFDRLLTAQAIKEDLWFMTRDSQIVHYPVRILEC